MIGLHSFVILWLLPMITIQTSELSSKDSAIDWTGCGTTTRCFCLQASDMLETSDGSKCNIGVQNKYFTEDIAVFQLQVIVDEHEFGKDPQLMIYRDTQELFGCKYDSKSEKYEVIADSDVRKNAGIELFEKRSRFHEGKAVCALKIKKAKNMMSWMNQNAQKNKKAKLKLISAHSVEYPIYSQASTPEQKLKFLTTTGINNCDPYSFKARSLKTDTDYHERFLENIDRTVLNCEEHGPSYSLRYEKEGGGGGNINELRCVKDDADNYYYVFKDPINGKDIKITDQEEYSFYCVAKIDEVCRKPVTDCKEGTELCPLYVPGAKDQPAQFFCPGKKYVINEDYLELNADPVCKRDSVLNLYEVEFFTKFKGFEEKTLNARCFNEYDCHKKSKLIYPSEENSPVDYSNGTMKCKDSNKNLRIVIQASNETLTAKSFKCNTTTGRWIGEKGASLPDKAQVSCPGEKELSEPLVKMSLEDMLLNAGLLFLGCAAVAGFVSLGIYCWYFKPKVFKTDGKRAWTKKSKAEKIAYCKDLFGKVSQSTIDTPYRVAHGFNLLETLLNTETVEPKIWEEVYPFLMRFQGSIEKYDDNIKRMFMRYMYLQAKTIIDKHGWLSDQQITERSKKTRKGLIRAVACRLLGFGFGDAFSDDAELFAQSGFRKLGFKAVEQYPHCGVLWSTLIHNRVLGNDEHKVNATFRPFDLEKFTENIQEIAFKSAIDMPDDDVIPEYGSPAEQAAFALGGSPNVNIHKNKKFLEMWEGGKSTAHLQYFAGICASIGRNPSIPIITALKLKDDKNENLLKSLQVIAEESEWNVIVEKTMKVMIYYGRPFDAKRLQTRFMPSVDQPSPLYSQTKIDQQFFEEAVDNQLEELRKWFAERTDKAQLKKAPVYKKDAVIEAIILAKLKLDKEKAVKAAAEAAAAKTAAAAAAVEGDAQGPAAAAVEGDPAAATPAAAAPAPAPAQPNPAVAPAQPPNPPAVPAAAAAVPPPVAPAAPPALP